ncbi:MAG TPA: hypothetical protein VJN94_06560, partial [Candidatus Binataceae bacterium]|nr:hypothetical protein [Candidatus Binataceae bacterium]
MIDALPPGSRALVLAPTQEAADEFVRGIAVARGATFGIERLMFNRLIGLLAAAYAAEHGLAFLTGLGAQALAARALFTLRGDPRVAWFGPVMELPGFARAVATAHEALSHNLVEAGRLRLVGGAGEALAAVFEQFDHELSSGRLLDRSAMIDAAINALAGPEGRRFTGIPLILLDVAADSLRERDLIAALAARAPAAIATVPACDDRSERFLAEALGLEYASIERATPKSPASNSLACLQEHLFADTLPPEAPLDESVMLRSAAGEMQECVELARQVQAAAREGVPFDRIAVLLHAPDRYAAYLEEAFARAGIPAWFARGASLPEPGGRALLALLNCAAERFSARRFAEYLSLAQLPDPAAAAASPAVAADASFVPADADFMPGGVEPAAGVADNDPDPVPQAQDEAESIVRAPWRWEQLLVDAAVVDGRERWEKRLLGLERELSLQRGELKDDEARAAQIDRNLADLAHLRAAALPIIGALAALPAAASWGEWLEQLRALTVLAIRDRIEVLRTLAELEPMAPVGPITLDEVRLVLSQRLGRLPMRPPRRRYGAVMV